MNREKHVSIDKASNGFVLYLTRPKKDDKDWNNEDTVICLSLEEMIKKIEDYFTETV